MQYCTCIIQLNFFFLKEIIQIKILIRQSKGTCFSSLKMVTFNRYHLIISLFEVEFDDQKKKLGHIPSELFSNKPGTADG